MDVVENLRSERAKLAERLEELDQLQTERNSVLTQISQVDKAIAVLTKPASVPGKREMSPEAKERIRAGLAKARAAKLAGGSGVSTPTAVTEQTAAAPTMETGISGKKPAASEKSESRGK